MSAAQSLFVSEGMNIDVAELAGLVCEGVVYGIFVTLFAGVINLLHFKRSDRSKTRPLIFAAFIMFLLATAQLVVDTVNIFEAFLDNSRLERVAFLSDPTKPIFAAKHAIFFTMIMVGDGVNTYRCFIIWNKKLWIALPSIILSVASGICAYQTIWATEHLASVSIQGEASWGTAVFSLSIAANLISTSLIAYRIWYNETLFKQPHSVSTRTSLMPILYILVESGALNAAYLIAYIAVLQSGSHGLEILAEFSTPFVGVIFSMMIVRIGLSTELSNGRNTSNFSSLNSGHTVSVPVPFNQGHTQVHVTHVVDSHDGDIELGKYGKDGF